MGQLPAWTFWVRSLDWLAACLSASVPAWLSVHPPIHSFGCVLVCFTFPLGCLSACLPASSLSPTLRPSLPFSTCLSRLCYLDHTVSPQPYIIFHTLEHLQKWSYHQLISYAHDQLHSPVWSSLLSYGCQSIYQALKKKSSEMIAKIIILYNKYPKFFFSGHCNPNIWDTVIFSIY